MTSVAIIKFLTLDYLITHKEAYEQYFGRDVYSKADKIAGYFFGLERTEVLEDCHVEVGGDFSPMRFHFLLSNGYFAHSKIVTLINENTDTNFLSKNDRLQDVGQALLVCFSL